MAEEKTFRENLITELTALYQDKVGTPLRAAGVPQAIVERIYPRIHDSKVLSRMVATHQGDYDFRGKLEDLVKEFSCERADYQKFLHAAMMGPELFFVSNNVMISHILQLVQLFKKDGLQLSSYLMAALEQPSLFFSRAETIEPKFRFIRENFDIFKGDINIVIRGISHGVSHSMAGLKLSLEYHNATNIVRPFDERDAVKRERIAHFLGYTVDERGIFSARKDLVSPEHRGLVKGHLLDAAADNSFSQAEIDDLAKTTYNRAKKFLGLVESGMFGADMKQRLEFVPEPVGMTRIKVQTSTPPAAPNRWRDRVKAVMEKEANITVPNLVQISIK